MTCARVSRVNLLNVQILEFQMHVQLEVFICDQQGCEVKISFTGPVQDSWGLS